MFAGVFGRTDQRCRRAIGQGGRRACGHRTCSRKRWLEARQAFHIGIRANAAIGVDTVDGDDLVSQLAGFVGCCCLAVRFDGEGFLRLAAELVALGNDLCRLTHAHVDTVNIRHQLCVQHGVKAAHGHAGHGLDPGRDEGIPCPHSNLTRCVVDRRH